MLQSYAFVLLFALVGIGLVAVMLAIPRLVAPRSVGEKKLTTYECGVDPIGPAWIQFNVRYYLVALLFIAFDVEVFFLMPWAVVYRELQGIIFWFELVLFIAILMLALLYAWKKRIFEW